MDASPLAQLLAHADKVEHARQLVVQAADQIADKAETARAARQAESEAQSDAAQR